MDEGILEIDLPQPLKQLIASCAIFCQVDCCELGAFDVNAYVMLWWLRDRWQSRLR